MPKREHKPRLAVLSPFVDKRHGTERCLAEQIERLADDFEIHLYSSRVEDIDLTRIAWHRVSMPPGPHVFRYVWWLIANRFSRWRDSNFRGLAPDIVYTPGVNCLDADVVSVHVQFSNVRRQLNEELKFRRNPITAWPVVLHRRIYYRLAMFMERRMYPRGDVTIAAVSQKVARQIREQFHRKDHPSVIYHGVDHAKFSPRRCEELRASARKELGIAGETIAILLIGNDWKNKGLPCVLEAVAKLMNPCLHVLVAGEDTSSAYVEVCRSLGLEGRVSFLPLRPDVEFYYAAADLYAGPSLEDTFSLPHAEAMACGLPVIASRAAGVSEIMHHGEDALILEDPGDAKTLSEWLDRLSRDADWRRKLGEAATVTAAQYTWERNALQLREILKSICEQRQDA
jgi:glycosyltransferase involved in cell wall biosynthesis